MRRELAKLGDLGAHHAAIIAASQLARRYWPMARRMASEALMRSWAARSKPATAEDRLLTI